MLRQASAEVGVAAACICDENDGLSMAPNKLHDPCAIIAAVEFAVKRYRLGLFTLENSACKWVDALSMTKANYIV